MLRGKQFPGVLAQLRIRRSGAASARREDGPFFRMLALTLIALIVGSIVSLAATAFIEAVSWLNNTLLISPYARIQWEERPWLLGLATILVPSLGGLIVGHMICFCAPSCRPLGPPDVIAAVQLQRDLPDLRSGAVSSLASVVSLGCGASVGQYGPMVYLGAMLSTLTNRFPFRIPNLGAISVSCGVAAAIATAFNAPIAGLIFAHEIVLRHYSTQAFAPTTVAAATGYVFSNVIFQREPLFLVNFDKVAYGYEFLMFGLMGIMAAGLAIFFMRLSLRLSALAKASSVAPQFRPAIAGLILGIVALGLPDILGTGAEALRFATIPDAYFPFELMLLIIAKLVLTAICLAGGFAGGVFSPALLIGIFFGAWCWQMLEFTTGLPNSGIVVYAICGMVALASPVIGAPLTAILIVFELTRSYDITIAAMVTVVFSNLICHRKFGRSLFDVQLQHRGFDLSAGRDNLRLETTPVHEVRTPLNEIAFGHQAMSAGEFLSKMREMSWQEGFVINDSGQLIGVVRRADIAALEKDANPISGFVQPARLVFDDQTSVGAAMRALDGFLGDAVPLVEKDSGKLLGAISEGAIIACYLDISSSLRMEENASL